jgi:hypothetical protein
VVLYRGLSLCPTHPRVSAILLKTIQNHAHDDLFVNKTAISALRRHMEAELLERCAPAPADGFGGLVPARCQERLLGKAVAWRLDREATTRRRAPPTSRSL